jgi:Ser/Thr protein kinase RdoA (MazF antagonist)
MYNNAKRDSDYINNLKELFHAEYNINASAITPATRGYYGETWKLETSNRHYFIKIDYVPRHKKIFRNSLPVVNYLCENGIDFINVIVKTNKGELYSHFNSGILGVFDWIDGENIETDDTKPSEYQMLCKIYPLTSPGFDIPAIDFTDGMATRFYAMWERLKHLPTTDANNSIKAILEYHAKKLHNCSLRLSHFATLCHKDKSDFYITHGDAGGNFFVSKNKNYIVDWDEVMYAPLERDAWVMGCRDWARKLFNETLKENNIKYKLRSERLAFYCYHMYFLYLGEFLDDFMLHGITGSIEEYFTDDYFMEERLKFADSV